MAEGYTHACPEGSYNFFIKKKLFAIDIATTTTSTTTTTTTTPAPASIEDCPEEDPNNWPHPWKVYGTKCYTLVKSMTFDWSTAKDYCEGVNILFVPSLDW